MRFWSACLTFCLEIQRYAVSRARVQQFLDALLSLMVHPNFPEQPTLTFNLWYNVRPSRVPYGFGASSFHHEILYDLVCRACLAPAEQSDFRRERVTLLRGRMGGDFGEEL